MAEIAKVRFLGTEYNIKSITDTSLSEAGTPADAAAVRGEVNKLIEVSFEQVNGRIETPNIVNGTWVNGGSSAGGNRAWPKPC